MTIKNTEMVPTQKAWTCSGLRPKRPKALRADGGGDRGLVAREIPSSTPAGREGFMLTGHGRHPKFLLYLRGNHADRAKRLVMNDRIPDVRCQRGRILSLRPKVAQARQRSAMSYFQCLDQ
jgi:hypothetical protein